jgi:hypothetical protein
MVLAAAPLVIHLTYFRSDWPQAEMTGPVYTTVLIAWNMIPSIWVASIILGVVAVTLKRSGYWRLAGIPAIVLPIAECFFVMWWLQDQWNGHPHS